MFLLPNKLAITHVVVATLCYSPSRISKRLVLEDIEPRSRQNTPGWNRASILISTRLAICIKKWGWGVAFCLYKLLLSRSVAISNAFHVFPSASSSSTSSSSPSTPLAFP